MYFLHFCSYILHEKCRGISSINESYRTLILSMLGILDLSGNKSKVYGQAIMKPFCISTERNFLSIDCTFCKFVTWPREIYFTKWWNSLNYHLLLQMNCFLFFSSSDSWKNMIFTNFVLITVWFTFLPSYFLIKWAL